MRKLSTKTEFAAQVGVNVSSITRLLQRVPDAEVSGKVDTSHPDIKKYIDSKTVTLTHGGAPIAIDALYDDAAQFCGNRGTWTARTIRTEFKIGAARAIKIFTALDAAGISSGKASPVRGKTVKLARTPKVKEEPEPIAKPKPAAKPRTVRDKPTRQAFQDEPTESDYGVDELPDDIREVLHWPLIKIIRKFGTATGFESYLKSAKLVEEIETKRIANHRANDELITKTLVIKTVIEPLDIAFARMLRDGSRSVTSVLTNRIKAGDTFEQCEAEVTKQLSAFIKPLKKNLGRGIK